MSAAPSSDRSRRSLRARRRTARLAEGCSAREAASLVRRSRSCENVFFVERGLVRFFGEKRFGEIFGGKRFGEILRGKKTAAIRSTPFSSLPLESSSPPPFHLIRPPNAHLDLGEEQPLRLEAAGGGRLLAPPARGVRGRRRRFERRETTTAIVVELERRAELEQAAQRRPGAYRVVAYRIRDGDRHRRGQGGGIGPLTAVLHRGRAGKKRSPFSSCCDDRQAGGARF